MTKKVEAKKEDAKEAKKEEHGNGGELKARSLPKGRVETGIHGLDEQIEGGFIPGSVNLVAGGCGSGKTLFSSQFLYHGAKLGEPGVLLSLEQRPSEIRLDMKDVGLDPTKYEKDGKLEIVYTNPTRFVDKSQVVEDSVESILEEHVKKLGAKRVVLDSLCSFELYLTKPHEVRQKIYQITEILKDLGVTAIMTSEIPERSNWFSRFGVEEFVADSVIVLNYMEFQGGNFRSCLIRKMRRTHQTDDILPFTVERGKGIVIKPAEERFHKYVLAKSRGKV
ncbi:MAG: ATPase domain-containing protein [archaeon]